MKYLVLFEDAADADPNIRTEFMDQHLGFLETHAEQIDAAGPLKASSGQGLDGCWIVEADNPRDVEHLIRADPFWPTGLRKAYRIMAWEQVFASGNRLINVPG